MINYQLFPRSVAITDEINKIIDCFIRENDSIDSSNKHLKSDAVLKTVCPHLESIGFNVETGKTQEKKINVPVLFGLNNAVDKCFNADAVSKDGRIVIEVEAGRAFANNQFLKDLFQACMMFKVEYLVLAVRNQYRGHNDFEAIYTWLETLYISNRIQLPLKGILLIGY